MDDTQKYMDELLATYKGVFNNNVMEGGLRFKEACSDFCHTD